MMDMIIQDKEIGIITFTMLSVMSIMEVVMHLLIGFLIVWMKELMSGKNYLRLKEIKKIDFSNHTKTTDKRFKFLINFH